MTAFPKEMRHRMKTTPHTKMELFAQLRERLPGGRIPTDAHEMELLAAQLRERFPEGRISLDVPSAPDGVWYLDVEVENHAVAIQWKDGAGFGIECSPSIAYGDGADETYHDLEAAYSRVVSLLLSKTYTAPPAAVRMRELRKERGISQEVLAESLNVRQSAISKLERRNDVLVSSIREIVRSMGGELRITAKFPDGMERTLEFGDGPHSADKSTRR